MLSFYSLIVLLGQATVNPTILSPEQAISDDILQNGVMGAVFLIVIVPLAWYTLRLSKQLDKIQALRASEMQAVQTARTADAQAVVDKLLTMTNKWNESVTEKTAVLESLVDTMKETKQILQAVKDYMIEDHAGSRRR